jgi:hypothetical protein
MLESAPSPEEIRALRGSRSRAELAAVLGVTPLTIYRWELPPGSPEMRRPRGQVLRRLLAWKEAEQAAPAPAPVSPSPAVAPGPEPAEQAALAPVLEILESCALEKAEEGLVELLGSGTLRTEAARARAAVALARIQLLARHDSRGAFATLLGAGADPARLPRPVRLEYHLVAAYLHAHADARLFGAGRSHHHAARAEELLDDTHTDARFLLWYARFLVAVTLFEHTLLARAMGGLPAVRDLATTPLSRCLLLEAEAIETLGLTNVAESRRRCETYLAAATAAGMPFQRLRGLTWSAELLAEEAAPPDQILSLLEQGEALQRRHRIADGMHTMLIRRNKGEVLLRLGRAAEAEAVLAEALHVAGDLGYTPVRIVTTMARLFQHGARHADARALGDATARAEDLQRPLTRAVGEVLLLLADVSDGAAPPDLAPRLLGLFEELRRLGVWPIAYRHLALHALGVLAAHGPLADAGRLLATAERATEWSPSPIGSALLRRHRAVVLARRGRLLEARQALEAALATFTAAADAPEAALARRALAALDELEGLPGAAESLAASAAELARLELAAPPPLRIEAGPPPAPPTPASAAGPAFPVERLVVPLQRLATRGVGAPLLHRELVAVAAELCPGRAVRLEELDSAGAATELLTCPGAGDAPVAVELGDGLGRRLRLGVAGPIEDPRRAALEIVAVTAGLALEVAGLRGLSTPRPAPSSAGAPPADLGPADFIAASPSMRRLRAELGRLSGSRATIIVTGESGTGKEVVARAIHQLSRRARAPYVTFNSATVPRDLFEGQLFGYRKGAFTGAVADHPGVIRAADGGTLFLDEIGELPLDVQPKLLRFLENGEILPLGERRPQRVDVRVIAATHRDLGALVRAGGFREDLYYRLQVIPVAIAPLRERPEDILALARFFLRRMTPPGSEPPVLLPDAVERLRAHPWPGNVRELRNVIERCLAFEPRPAFIGGGDLRL